MMPGGVCAMTTKEMVLQALSDLPEDADIEAVIERLYFLHKLQQRIEQKDDVEKFTQEEAMRRMARWLP